MFSTLHDPAYCLRVSRSWLPATAGDFEASLQSLRQFRDEARLAISCPVHVLIQEDTAVMTATERRQIAELVREIQVPRLMFAMVSTSLLHRGALKAICWLAPPPPGHRVDAFAALGEAHRWIESSLEAPMPTLFRLATQLGHRPGR